ncbi:MdtA/MuxA family multidrug efflux RND transporter periplasmic adaptor subunit [Acidisphaera rubrifaciens]|uniref:Multidrug resistance efflux pump acriflavin resistance protein HlyD/AcrB/AcrD/AcrF n=1 Tax=Acidisphaera rubrifaciens HS-AP3 TaxID=1231350 RepID=A0A0D6PC02_9PROT|nr:MdtA/MuxA family multidrug efflux RND transporter periplasmic adaptor subunit [Acidisphaera rubrifaciens]GAN78394.1 multidrug resistance efflux pump acriflavin resistance protein HlyD/AcrB/AcrD/AcrF [Acidisphaera rubrifaciens HS-AP3]
MDEQVSRTEPRAYDPPGTSPPAPARTAPTPPPPDRPGTPRRRRGGAGRAIFWIILIGGIALLLWFRPWTLIGGKGTPHAGGPPPPSVQVATVARGDMPVTIDGLGTVTPLATVTVRTQIAGYIQRIDFTEGQMVRPGDPLVQIDPRPYQVALEQAQGTLARDQALLAEAQLDLKRYQRLASQDSIARQQVDTQNALVQQYVGTVKADQGAVDTQKLNLVYCRIVSPIDGRVGLRLVDLGNYVSPSDTTGLVVLTQLQPMSVVFTVAEDTLSQILPRVAAGAKLPVIARDRSDQHTIATGVLSALDSQVDTTTGTVRIRAMYDNKDDMLFPQEFVNARLVVNTLRNVVLVSNAAVQHGAPGTYVYVLKPDHTVAVQVIETGPTDGLNTAVLKGLDPGEQVVTDGVDRLREGARVMVAPSHGAAEKVPAASPAASPAAKPGR